MKFDFVRTAHNYLDASDSRYEKSCDVVNILEDPSGMAWNCQSDVARLDSIAFPKEHVGK